MKTLRPFLPILVAVLFGGIAHASEFSLGGGHLLAQNTAQPSVDISVTFTDHGRSMRENAEGGDREPSSSRSLRGADDASSSTAAPAPRAAAEQPAAKPVEPAAVTSESPHGVSISPAAALRRPSYRWQSLVPGTIK
ncbi:MAG: hypothetical protein ACREPX_11900 [Rhodanobacteraceae bacterium]